MSERHLRVLAVASHAVQYSAPLFRLMAQDPRLDFHVAYCSLRGAESSHDPDFNRDVKWDIPLLDGYAWAHVPNRGSHRASFLVYIIRASGDSYVMGASMLFSVTPVILAPLSGSRTSRLSLPARLSYSAPTRSVSKLAIVTSGSSPPSASSGHRFSSSQTTSSFLPLLHCA